MYVRTDAKRVDIENTVPLQTPVLLTWRMPAQPPFGLAWSAAMLLLFQPLATSPGQQMQQLLLPS